MNALMASIADELERTGRVQLQASDPAASVWVSANAGTGKTHVLENARAEAVVVGRGAAEDPMSHVHEGSGIGDVEARLR